jgi:hypothetical protein
MSMAFVLHALASPSSAQRMVTLSLSSSLLLRALCAAALVEMYALFRRKRLKQVASSGMGLLFTVVALLALLTW